MMELKKLMIQQAVLAIKSGQSRAANVNEDPVLRTFLNAFDALIDRHKRKSPLAVQANASVNIIDVSATGCAFEATFSPPEKAIIFLSMEKLAELLQRPREPTFPLRVAYSRPIGKRFRIGGQFVGLPGKVVEGLAKLCSVTPKSAADKESLSISERSVLKPEVAEEDLEDLTPETTVLIIDDDKAARSLLAQYLKAGHFEVIQASDGPSGLKLYEENQHVALILLDWMLPGMQGPDVLAELMKQPGAPPVLMLTGNTRHENVVSALKAGALDYVVKPSKEEEILFKIQNILKWEGSEKRRRRSAERRTLPLTGSIAFTVSEVGETSLSFQSTFSLPPGSNVFLECPHMAQKLGVRSTHHFIIEIVESEGKGNNFTLSGRLVGCPPELLSRIGDLSRNNAWD
ncbi:MAG: response regulator [Planctomycetota bacterium]